MIKKLLTYSFLLLVFLLTLLTVNVAYAVPGPKENKKQNCHKYAAKNGSNSNSGSRQSPFKSAEKLVASLNKGEHGCFKKGQYSFLQLSIDTPRIRLMSVSGQKVTLKGRIRVEREARGVIIKNLYLNGKNKEKLLGPLIYADNTVLRNNDITNKNQAICVHLSSYYDRPAPKGVKIINNKIHHCGELPATNHHHGIYITESKRTLIKGNWIYKNADRGIQFYPNADNNKVINNVIYKNGQGVIFSGLGGQESKNNLVTGNIIMNSRLRFNVEGSVKGNSNLVKNNCLYTNEKGYYSGDPEHSGVLHNSPGFKLRNNKIKKARFKNVKKNDYRIKRSSSCFFK